MRRKLFAALALIMMIVMCFGMNASSAFAAEKDSTYEFKVMVYSGEQGHFTKAGDGELKSDGKVWVGTYKGTVKDGKCQYDRVEISADDLGFVLDNDKYYMRGFRVAGHDNDETEITGYQNMTFTANQDVSYEVAYGIRGGMVAYRIHYVDGNGKQLHKPDTYYGMANDNPVVSYKYIEGYLPDAYNLGKRLSKDESKNDFTFTYHKMTSVEQKQQVVYQAANPQAPGTTGNPAGTRVAGTNAAGNSNGGAAGTVNSAGGANGTGEGEADGVPIGENPTPIAGVPDQFTDINEEPAPIDDGSENAGFLVNHLPLIVGAGITLIGLLAILLYLLRRRRAEGEFDFN